MRWCPRMVSGTSPTPRQEVQGVCQDSLRMFWMESYKNRLPLPR